MIYKIIQTRCFVGLKEKRANRIVFRNEDNHMRLDVRPVSGGYSLNVFAYLFGPHLFGVPGTYKGDVAWMLWEQQSPEAVRVDVFRYPERGDGRAAYWHRSTRTIAVAVEPLNLDCTALWGLTQAARISKWYAPLTDWLEERLPDPWSLLLSADPDALIARLTRLEPLRYNE